MDIAVSIAEPRLTDIKGTDDKITAFLNDGRVVSVPLSWSWRLSDAMLEQRQHFEIIGGGIGELAGNRRRHQRGWHVVQPPCAPASQETVNSCSDLALVPNVNFFGLLVSKRSGVNVLLPSPSI